MWTGTFFTVTVWGRREQTAGKGKRNREGGEGRGRGRSRDEKGKM
jgi:hypothetical protein